MMKKQRKKLMCLRCGYSWFPVSAILPGHCPKGYGCGSPYWNKKRSRKMAEGKMSLRYDLKGGIE